MKIYRSMVVPLCVALCAAIFAHNLIDVIGDYVLPHDTFDDVAHGSRFFFGAIALGLAVSILWVAVRGAVHEARGSEAAFCRALRGLAPGDARIFFVTTLSATFGALLAMQALDNVLAGVDADDVGSLFGGSLLLGSVCTFVCGFVAAFVARALFDRLVSCRRAFIGMALALLLSPGFHEVAGRACRSFRAFVIAAAPCVCRVCAGRAPPSLPTAA